MCQDWASTTLSEETTYSDGKSWSAPVLAAYGAVNATLGKGFALRIEAQQIFSEEEAAEATNYMLGGVFSW